MRIGHGYDVHKFEKLRPLILGGVQIPHSAGLAGHSDADVLLHAAADSLLGAAAAGDIGFYFPDTDPAFKNADSLILLKKAYSIIRNSGFVLVNLDCTIVAQAPKLRPFIDEMRSNIALALETDLNNINVKATTEEGLGFTGAELGIAAHAVCLIAQK